MCIRDRDRHSRYAVTNCICAVQKRIEERGECEYPLERCISYDEWADYYVENEEGHYVDKQYILDMFKLADEYKRGLVVQVSNSVDGEFQCLCCPCCCGLVAMGKFLSGPCDEIQGNYVLEHDTSK